MDKWLENDLIVKIVSVVLAAILWLQVSGSGPAATETQVQVGVTVSWRGLAPGLAVASIAPENVTVTIRGPNSAISTVTASTLGATVNLAGASAGRTQFPVQVALPRGVTVQQVTPQNVTVVLEPIIDRQRTVQVQTAGTVADGYKADAAVSSPAQVIVHGPQSQVDKVASVTASVGIGGATVDVTATVTPRALDANGKPVTDVTVVPAQVQVTVPVRPAVITKSVNVNVNVQGKPASGYTVASSTASPAQVTVSGTAAALAGLSQVSTAPVDVTGAKADVTKTVGVVLPDGVTSAQPNQVAVTVHITAGH